MMKTHNWIWILVIAIVISSCGAGCISATPLPTNTATPLPTKIVPPLTVPLTSVPTNTPEPTSTPMGGGSSIAFTRWMGTVNLMNSDGSDAKTIVQGHSGYPQWSPDGKWLTYLINDDLFQMDADSTPIRTAQLWVAAPDGSNARQVTEFKYPQLAHGGTPLLDFLPTYVFWSPDSTQLAYLNYVKHEESRESQVDFEIMVASVSGGDIKQVATTTLAWDDWTYRIRPLAWSPDGSHIAYTNFSSSEHGLYIVSENGDQAMRLIDSKFASYPTWTDDGKSIIFIDSPILSHARSGAEATLTLTPGMLKLVSVEGGDVAVLSEEQAVEPMLSPDGSQVAFHVASKGIVVLNLSDKTEIVVSPACATFGSLYSINWSPDGRLLAFESGTPFVNGCTFDDSTGWRVFNLQGAEIVRIPSNWGGYSFSPDSTRFVATTGGTGELMIANLLDGSISSLGSAQVLGPTWQP